MVTSLALTVALLAAPAAQIQSPSREIVAEVRVHGNQIVPDAEVLELAGVVVGTPFTEAVLTNASKRLRDSGKFESIEVLKRFASIEDASRIIVVIIVNEGPVRIVMPGIAGGAVQIRKRTFLNNLMFVPILEAQDGYGFTFGARIAYPRVIGPNSRMSFPLMWGGTKRFGVEVDRTFSSGPLSRIEFGAVVQRRRNPALDEQDDRQRLWGRAQRYMGPVRIGATAGWQKVSFAALNDTIRSAGADITLDTRENPAFPRNAVLVTASAERLFFNGGQAITRTRVDAVGYIGLFGQHVIVVRALREGTGQPLPPYLKSILGGTATLRGFKTGFMIGDTLVAGSIELRMPITSPLNFGKLGVSVFADWGIAYDHGQAFADQKLRRGIGGSAWFSVGSVRVSLALAHGRGSGMRVHFSGTLGF